MQYVRGNLQDGETFAGPGDAQARTDIGCSEKARLGVHGTTGSGAAKVFEAEDAPLLLPVPTGYDVPLLSTAKVHRDHHIHARHRPPDRPLRRLRNQLWDLCRADHGQPVG